MTTQMKPQHITLPNPTCSGEKFIVKNNNVEDLHIHQPSEETIVLPPEAKSKEEYMADLSTGNLKGFTRIMTTQMKHTQTPWKEVKSTQQTVNEDHGEVPISIGNDAHIIIGHIYNKDDAAFIVKACNAHDDLVRYVYLENIYHDGSLSQFQANEIFMKNGWNPTHSIRDFLYDLRAAVLNQAQAGA